MIKHFDTCTPHYPEKEQGELPQATVEIMEGIRQCVDCGAFDIGDDKTHIILGERIRRRDNHIARLKTRIKNLEKQVEFLA